MIVPILGATLLALALAGFHLGRTRALEAAGGAAAVLHSRPNYHGYFVAIWTGLPALALAAVWLFAERPIVRGLVEGSLPAQVRELPDERLELFLGEAQRLAHGGVQIGEPDAAVRQAADQYVRLRATSRAALLVVALALAVAGLTAARRRIAPDLRARNLVERTLTRLLVVCSTVAILVTVGIVLSLVFEASRFFRLVPVSEFLFGLQWSPQTALRADQVGSSGAFGAVPVFAGTLLITLIAMAVAVPVGLMSAVYLSDYAAPRTRTLVKPLLEILAGIPTVVYGFFAALSVAPLVRRAGEALGLGVASESALAAGLVMGVMIIPFVSSLSDDVINAVPLSLREGSLALGATRSETMRKVVLPAALPGIMGATLLAVSRAIGETMIVVMAAGLAANLTASPLEAVTTVTVQIVSLLVGDQEFDSAKTLAAFALGLLLFVVTLGLNVIALTIVRRYREMYD
jgi:phosphate transport system permease protein